MHEVDTPPSLSRPLRWLTGVVITVVTVVQITLPGINQDVRYVVGAVTTAGAEGLSWTEIWAHRPLLARGILAALATFSPGSFWASEALIRLWSILLAAGAAWLLWRGLGTPLTPRMSGWVALAVGCALGWAPGWDFAEPEWYATVLAVAAIGVALRGKLGPWLAGLGLAAVTLIKYTTAAYAVVALIILAMLVGPRDRRFRVTTATTLVATPLGFGLTVLIEPREWQWLRDMPTLNPGFRFSALPALVEGLTNAAIVAPITIVGLVAAVALLADRSTRRHGVLALVALALLTAPFVIQQQGFLYHLSAVPVAAAALTAAVATAGSRVPIGLVTTGLLGLIAGVGLFAALGPRQRDQTWWLALLAIAVLFVIGVLLVAFRIHRAGAALVLIAMLAPLLVTVSPRTAYSFSLAHNRTTALSNLDQARGGAERRANAHLHLPPQTPVLYLSFSAPYWLGNPTPCRYVSPTFLQRAVGARAVDIAATPSFTENLACLSDRAAEAVVIETGWFDVDRVRPEVRSAVEANFDCAQPWFNADGLLICPRR